MKFVFLFLFLFASFYSVAQKYALLNTHLVQKISYADAVTPKDKIDGLFPVEIKMLPQFINALREIENKLLSNHFNW